MSVLGVVPAAGFGTRLGLATPKVLAPVLDGVRVWDLLADLLTGRVDDLVVVLAPQTVGEFAAAYPGVATTVQATPTGTGDAVFAARAAWAEHSSILVVWGDQANLSAKTVDAALRCHRQGVGPRITLPVVRDPNPYVQYRFDGDRLLTVSLSREEDRCEPGGWADVGLFVLTTAGLDAEWRAFCAASGPQAGTGERNFLPLLPWLSGRGWAVRRLEVPDPGEARGINDRLDLAFTARRRRTGASACGS